MNLHEIIFSNEINFGTATLRLLVSFVVGLLIGIEREAHNQPAGMRTHILICIGSTLAMLLSIYIPQLYPGFQNGDPGRIAAQVVTGIGFLGAGAIFHFGVNVKGLTTAASIWVIAMLGMTIGAGMFKISAVAVVIILFSLSVMDIFEKFIFQDKIFKRIEITVRKKTVGLTELRNILTSMKIRVTGVDVLKNTAETTDKYVLYVYIPVKLDPQQLSEKLEKTEGVLAFSEEMFN